MKLAVQSVNSCENLSHETIGKPLTYIFRSSIPMILDIILTSFFGVAIFYAHIFLKNMPTDE